jgi:glutaminyl-peptide cyclotransferase
MNKKYRRWLIAGLIMIDCLIAIAFIVGVKAHPALQSGTSFDGDVAYQDVIHQVSLGPRIPGSLAHQLFLEWVRSELTKYHWQVEIQEGTLMGHRVQNVIARKGRGAPWFILGAHYDSRLWADQDPDLSKRKQPVPGANDGASGVAVLLELARKIPDNNGKQIWLVFFDAEDNGNIPGWDWLLGSKVFVSKLTCCPNSVVVVDMIGDSDLQIYEEKSSDPGIVQQIWAQASKLGYGDHIISTQKYAMEDDHTPFLQAGMPAIDMIDFDYPYWHTTQDTPDKVSGQSLKVVGQTLLAWLAP